MDEYDSLLILVIAWAGLSALSGWWSEKLWRKDCAEKYTFWEQFKIRGGLGEGWKSISRPEDWDWIRAFRKRNAITVGVCTAGPLLVALIKFCLWFSMKA